MDDDDDDDDDDDGDDNNFVGYNWVSNKIYWNTHLE